jgi:ComEC/Rec2-related protein
MEPLAPIPLGGTVKAFFQALPSRFDPPWSLALGIAAGFYPLFMADSLRLALSLVGAALLAVLLARGWRGQRLWLLGAFVLGSLIGLALAAREAALPPLGPAPHIPQAPSAAVRSPQAAASSQAPLSGTAQPRPLRVVGVVGIEGRLAADSTPARGGLRSYDLEASCLLLAAPGLRGECETRGSLRLLLRDGPPLAAGAVLRVSGDWGREGGGVFFGDRASLIVKGEGGALARLRNGLHEAFIAAIGAVVRGSSPESTALSSTAVAKTASHSVSDDAEIEDAAGLLIALLSGWQDGLSPEDKAAFRSAGCTHVLALSGQHLALIAAALVFLLRPLLGPRRALLPALALATLYVIVVGPGPSLRRALISFALATLATLVDRPQEGRSLLGLCFICHALQFPDELREAGCVLSYLAVGGLVVLAPRFDYSLSPWLPPPLLGPISTSLAAQAATSPWIALVFGVFQPVGVLATVATSLLVEAVMILGLVGALLGAALPPILGLIAPIERLLLHTLSTAMALFARLPSPVLSGTLERAALALAIALFALFIYARPHVEHLVFRRRWRASIY